MNWWQILVVLAAVVVGGYTCWLNWQASRIIERINRERRK